MSNADWWQSPEAEAEIGAATAAPPAPTPAADPGDIYRFGPNFVEFVTQRFAQVETLLAAALDQLRRDRAVEGWRQVKSAQTDASGDLTLELFQTNPNQKLALHRLYVAATGYTFASPFNGAGAMLEIQVNGKSWDGVSLVASAAGGASLPAVFTASRLQTVEAQDGETLTLKVTGGPASTMIEARLLGVLAADYNNLG